MDLTMGTTGGDPNISLGVSTEGDPNISLGVLVMNQTHPRSPPYSPVATATMAIAITIMMLFTIFGNILVIIAVLTSRSLHGPQNLFLVSLAAADILVATLIIPFSLANELMGYWYFRTVWCEIYLALDVFFCTSSIAHLCAISLDRYLSVSRPVSYVARRTAGRIKAAIVVVWLIAAVISFPPLLSIDKSQEEEEPSGGPQCKLNSDRWYILYSTVGSFFAPCLIMILVYVRIYQIAKRHTRCPPGEPRRDVSASASPQRGLGGGGEDEEDGGGRGGGQRNGVVGVMDPTQHPNNKKEGEGAMSRPPTLDVGPSSSSSSQWPAQDDTPAPAPTTTTSPVTQQPPPPPQKAHAPPPSSSNAPEQRPDAGPRPHQVHERTSGGQKRQAEAYNDDSSSPESDNDTPENHGTNGTPAGCAGPRTLAQKCRTLVVTSKGTQLAKVVKSSGTPNTVRRKALVNREKRFTFVLAVVIGVFVICWFPFFFSYSLKAICPDTCSLPDPLFNFFFWIGYCNSSLNPLIYTIFNKDFRKAFKKILCKDSKNSAF